MTNQKLEKQTIAKAIVLFVISYGILFFLGRVFYAWDSPMFFLPPIVGFVFTYFLLDWIDRFYETGAAHKWFFPVLILVLAFVAEYITLFWYYGSIAQLNGKPLQITFDASAATHMASDAYIIAFIYEFKISAFLPFVLSCILGWLSHVIIDSAQQKKKE